MPTVNISLRVNKDFSDCLQALAKANHRSVTGQTIYLIERGLASLNAADSEQGRDLAAFVEARR